MWPCLTKSFAREAPAQTQAHEENCALTGAAASLGECCVFIDSRFTCNIAYRPKVLHQ